MVMRYKKHMIILLAAIFLFAMATASATDSNDTAVAVDDGQLTDEIIQASENQENTIQASYNDEVNLSEDDSGKLAIGNDKKLGKTVTGHTFRDIDNAIESDCTIYLEPGTYTGNDRISFSQKSNIKIIGNSTILDAQGQTQIFYISESSNITIQNIIFKNGYTVVNGGAIEVYYNCQDCSISNCTFINNTAYNGGAISWASNCDNGRISNCTFINNYAENWGGAIYWDNNGDDGRVNDCIFINNTARENFVIYVPMGVLNADYNWFGNTATNYNGNLPITYPVKCDYRLFLNSTANPDTITGKDTSNVTFKLYQYHSGVVSDYDNAPFKNLNLTITATNGNVKGTAKLGEPIQFTPTGKGTASVTATVETVRQTVEINVLKGDFDLLQDLVNNESLSIINLERSYTYNEFDTITDGVRINRPITINGNGYTIDAKGKSRIFYIEPDAVVIENLTLKNGKAYGSGGAIYFDNSGAVTNCNFADNIASGGGAVYFNMIGIVTNCTFTDNSANGGGAIYMLDGTVTNSNFINNHANGSTESEGGAICSYRGTVSNCNFADNIATTYGGALYFNSVCTVSNCSFTANSVDKNNENGAGGAIYFYNDDSHVFDSIFVKNSAANYGAVHLSSVKCDVSGCIFVNNSANKGIVGQAFDSTDIIQIHENIFLNNNVSVNIIDFAAGENVDANFNWFGSNATDYTKNPDLQFGDVWLFLNATADPDSVIVSGTSDITFKLYAFDSTSNIVSDYNFAFTDPVGLTVTAMGGNASSSIIDFGETVTYTANTAGTGKITASIENAAYTIEVNVIKANSTLTVDDMVFEYNAIGSTTVSFTNATGVKANVVNHTEAIVKVEEKTITVSNLAIGNYTLNVTTLVDGNHNPVTETAAITVKKAPTEISIINQTLNLKAKDTVSDFANLTPADAGNLTYSTSDKSIVRVSEDGLVMADRAGNATVTVSFAGSDNYAAAENKTVKIIVTLANASVSVNNSTLDLFVGDTFDLTATTAPADLNVTFVPDNSGVVDVSDNGKVTAIKEGTATITVKVGGDGVYAENSTTVNVSVSKIPAEIVVQNDTVDLMVGEEFDPVVGLMPSGAGNLSFKSSNVDVVLVNGHGFVLAIGEGNATVTVAFDGNEKYAAVSRNITVSVTKIPTEITLTNETLDLKVNDMVDGLANLTPADAGNLTFISSDEEVVFVADGMILAYGKGTATVTVSFEGNDKYAAAENKTITVNVSLRDASVSVENSTLDLKVDDRFDLNATTVPDWLNVEYVSSDESVATVTDYGIVVAVGEGTATITVTVGDDLMFAVNSTNVTVTVKKQDANANVSIPENITVDENSTVNVVLPEDATGNVTVTVDGETVDTVPVENGTASVKLPELNAGNHTVEIAYSGDDKYNSASKTATITVNKDSTNITAADVTATYKVNKYLVINLTDSKGNPLANSTVTVELTTAKNYTSDENGQIKVKVSSLVPKTYTAKIAFKGDDKYSGSNTTAEVTVKKATAKITAKAKTFKTTTKTKKYTVMLKANGKALKNKWVYLKVNGKKYKAKTNSKGKATFKITQLNKAGKFKAAVTFKGNDYYKKATKKATIKVKSVWKTVQKGSKNSAIVKKIQRALKNHGYYLEYNGRYLMVDGIFWDYTEMAVKEFQNDKTLKVTGKVDEKTARKLGII